MHAQRKKKLAIGATGESEISAGGISYKNNCKLLLILINLLNFNYCKVSRIIYRFTFLGIFNVSVL